ncbi:substrate-binding periplasmic protein, partial [Piscirickettsia litoralis]
MKIVCYFFIFILITPYTFSSIKLATGNNYPPFSDESLPNGGIATQLVKEITRNMGISSIMIDFKPWKRGYQETLDHQYLATFPYGKNSERQKKFYYSKAIFTVDSYFWVRTNSHLNKNNFFKEKLIFCVPLGYDHSIELALFDRKKVTIIQRKNPEKCLWLVEKGKADTVSLNSLLIEHYLKKNNNNTPIIKKIPYTISNYKLYLITSKIIKTESILLKNLTLN